MGGIGHSRRRIALFVCLAWLLAVVGLPALHEAHHEADHSHAIDGSIVGHHHDEHGAHVPAPERPRTSSELAIDHPIESGHQAGGVTHHGIAVLQVAPPALPPVRQLVARVELSSISFSLIAIHTQPSARGPPLVA